MSYFKDLDLVRYQDGPCSADDWRCPLLAIGWLENGHVYPTGICVPQVTARLNALRDQFGAAFPGYSFRGWHACSMCNGERALLCDSHVNLFIPGRDVVYMATGRVDHYIDVHSYAPPLAFVDTLMACPDPGSAEYKTTLFRLNGGEQPPLFL